MAGPGRYRVIWTWRAHPLLLAGLIVPPLVISGGISAILPRMAHARRVKSVKAAHLSPARDHILALMLEQLEAIRAHEPGTRAGADPEELHRMRTAVRRLRVIVTATREMFD